MYRSYSFSNMPQPLKEIHKPPIKPSPEKCEKKEEHISSFSLKNDDVILLLVIAVLIFNECDDKLLLLALVYIFFSEYIGDITGQIFP